MLFFSRPSDVSRRSSWPANVRITQGASALTGSLPGGYSLVFVVRPMKTGLTGPSGRSDRFALTGPTRCWFYEFAQGRAHVAVHFGINTGHQRASDGVARRRGSGSGGEGVRIRRKKATTRVWKGRMGTSPAKSPVASSLESHDSVAS